MSHPRLGVNVHQAGEPALQLAASLGISMVRVDGVWNDLQPAPDRWTWAWLDDLLATCATLGLEVFCTLSQCPPWVSPNRGDLPPLYHWEAFCREFAHHYQGKLRSIGCWNEWGGSSDDYVRRLLRPMAEACKAVDASYQICGPEIETERDWPDRLRDILALGGDCLDVLTVHAYAATGQKVWDALTKRHPLRPRWLPAFIPYYTPSVQQVIEASGWRGPVWLTETGWQSSKVGDVGQAQNVDQLLERFMGTTVFEKVCLYQLLDEPGVTFGLFDRAGEPKPAARVVQSYAAPGVG